MNILTKASIAVNVFCLIFTSFLLGESAKDFEDVSPQVLNTRKVCLTRRVNLEHIAVDGKIGQQEWDKVDWHGDFIQRSPYEGKKSSYETRFKVTYDDKNLYVLIRAFDDEPSRIVRRISRRDEIDGDWLKVDIDSYNDKKTSFFFAVNAAGVRHDGIITNDGEQVNENWDPIWSVQTSIDQEGWLAELSIPFSQLRFTNAKDHTWGIQVTRNLFRKEETSNWQFTPRNSSGWVHCFGQLMGLKDIHAGKQLQLVPYTVGKIRRYAADADNPFNPTGQNEALNFGLDGKYSLTSDLTVDFTVNPDFGQVEADPSVINLTAFESYFEEKRPFFIEGKNILSFNLMVGDGDLSNDNLFYSRRIGQTPQYYPDGDYVEMPENTTILGAVKLTGKTRKGLSIGVMESLTSPESAFFSLNGLTDSTRVQPLTNYFMVRLQQDLNGGSTTFGGALTAVNRSISENHLDFLHRSAYTGGIDFLHQWKNKSYNISGRLVFSTVYGSEEAITNTQQSPMRYYQRPDATHLTLEEGKTSLQGFGGTFWFGKMGGGNLYYSGGVTFRSPGLELNDMGYMSGADSIMQWVWAQYRIVKPFFLFRDIRFNFNQWQGWNFAGEPRFSGGNFGIGGNFKNYWYFWISTNVNGSAISDSLLRGGPSFYRPSGRGYNCTLMTDSRKRIRLSGSYSWFYRGEDTYDSKYYGLSLTYKPTDALAFSISPSFNEISNSCQYIDTVELQDHPRYLLASIDQKTYRLTVRLNYSITPKLSIQFYAQPFVATGDYTQFKRVVSPRAEDASRQVSVFTGDAVKYDANKGIYSLDENNDGVMDYSVENPNFNFLQFASNLVIRWEYAPGSTVYLVWSQGRAACESDIHFNYGQHLNHLFNIHPDNVFLIKFSYNFR